MKKEQSQPQPPEAFDSWALVEIMGRQQIVGRVTEAVIAGGAFLRVDVPAFNGSKAFTRFYGASSIYCISPVTEDVARQLLSQTRFRNEPVERWQLPQLAEKVDPGEDEDPGPLSEHED